MSLLRWCRRLAFGLVAGTCLAALTAGLAVPRAAGATPYVVLTGSMTPGLPPGTLVVVRPVPVERIVVGSVVTYQLRSGQPEVVTHRVVSTRMDLDGHVQWLMRGDANDAADPEWVREEQIRGRLWYSVPLLGHVSTWLTGAERRLLCQLLAVVLLGYALLMFARSIWPRRAGPHDLLAL